MLQSSLQISPSFEVFIEQRVIGRPVSLWNNKALFRRKQTQIKQSSALVKDNIVYLLLFNVGGEKRVNNANVDIASSDLEDALKNNVFWC